MNHQYFQQKSNQPDGNTFIYFIIHSFIQFVFFTVSSITAILNKSIDLPGINYIYLFLKEINKQYLIGRNRLMLSFGQFMFKTFMPPIGFMGDSLPSPIQNSPIINNHPIENKKTFNNENEMNDFLDELIKKKDN
tara:strand:- start:1282 stop:1686 length:405 start_codon:yes stop_codon:yes gene_type:complete